MGKYLKKFENHTEYEAFTATTEFIKPNVSYCVQENEVYYNPWTYADAYLTTVALEDGTISFNIWQSMGTDMITSISYSTDNGETWTTTNNVNDKEDYLTISVNVNEGDKVLWKGDAQQLGYYEEEDDDCAGSFFSSDCEFNVQGNVMSMLYGDDFKGEDTLEYDGQFACLFHDYDENYECLVVSAEHMVLPATKLANNCYQNMFYGCTSLTTAPSELPATTLAYGCYYYMFRSCTSLTTAPELLATTLANYCYNSMFQYCSSLTTAPELPATTLATSCYDSMFNGCTSLTTAPELPATTLANGCYNHMFQNCTSLATAPSELPATTLASRCYDSMFYGCTSLATAPQLPATTLTDYCYNAMFYGCRALTTAPELPATTLTDGCYQYMFSKCTSLTTAPVLSSTTLANDCYYQMFAYCSSLTTAPELPATTLARGCYANMFEGCSGLNYIKAMFTTTPSTSYTRNWVSGVAASGTFVKSSAASWSLSGVNGIPNGWTVETASPPKPISIWVDDFINDEILTLQERAIECGYNTAQEYMNAYLLNLSNFGCNKYEYLNETFEYGGNTYYLWHRTVPADNNAYILTSTINYNELYSHSMEYNINNEYCPYVAVLDDDFNVTYTSPERTTDWLVAVEDAVA